MPYIPQIDRVELDYYSGYFFEELLHRGISNGELNYLFTKLAQLYLKKHGTSYNTISDVIKAFECAKLEFYRRIAAPYEDEKCRLNGDVY